MDIPTAYVGYVGRMTYAYKKRYMVDLNAGYNGSENFAPDKRFGFSQRFLPVGFSRRRNS